MLDLLKQHLKCLTYLVFDSLSSVWVFLNFLNLRHEIVIQNKNSWWSTTTVYFLVLYNKNTIEKQISYLHENYS